MSKGEITLFCPHCLREIRIELRMSDFNVLSTRDNRVEVSLHKAVAPQNLNEIELICDGSVFGNPGPAGWACIKKDGESESILRGFEEKATNNRVELLAILGGLLSIPDGAKAVVKTDCLLAIRIFEGVWTPKANLDLIKRIWTQLERTKIRFEFISGRENPADIEAKKALQEGMKSAKEETK